VGFAGVFFSTWEHGRGELLCEDQEEFCFGVGGEGDVWDAGEVQELRAGRGDEEEGC